MDLELETKTFLVTGGASGIGEAVVRALSAEGAKPIILDRDAERSEIVADDTGAEVYRLDLTDDKELALTLRRIIETHGGIDGVVNNAGVNDGIGLSRSPAEFRESLDRNLVHAFATVSHTREALAQSEQGAIVNVLSKVAFTGQGHTSGYAAAKGALAALTREWALELAESGTRVNAVVPAEVLTPMYHRWLDLFDDPAKVKADIEARIPLGQRFTTPGEIADAIVFLLSPRSAHTTGQLLFVDGGYSHLDRAFP